jgi:hypothetical protein
LIHHISPEFAVKVGLPDHQDIFENEIVILSQLPPHPNIIGFINASVQLFFL